MSGATRFDGDGKLRPPQIPTRSQSNTSRERFHLVSHDAGSIEEGNASLSINIPSASSGSDSAGDSRQAFSDGGGSSLGAMGDDWTEWVREYSKGTWTGKEPPPRPAALDAELVEAAHDSPSSPHSSLNNNSGFCMPHLSTTSPNATTDGPSIVSPPPGFVVFPDSSSRSSASARDQFEAQADHLLTFYKKNGYLPAVKSEFEPERMKIIRRFQLDQKQRKENISRICSLARMHFKSATVIITLVFESHSVVAAEAGFDPSGKDPALSEPVRVLPELPMSVCAHGILRPKNDANDLFVVKDLSQDWRFANNPQSLASGGSLGSYISANILLPTSATVDAPETPTSLPVGSICVLGSQPMQDDAVPEADRKFLSDCADMVAREFQLGHEASRRTQEQRQSAFVSKLLETMLVQPIEPRDSNPVDPAAPSTTAVREGQQNSASTVSTSFQNAAIEFMELAGASSACVLDLRSFRAPYRRSISRNGHAAAQSFTASTQSEDVDSPQKGTVEGETLFQPSATKGKIYVLMQEAGEVDWSAIVRDEQAALGSAVSQSLSDFYEDPNTLFDSISGSLPLQEILPDNVTSCCMEPIFDEQTPALLIILTSSDPFHTFDAADSKFTKTVGSVLASALLRERAMAVDRAKLAFVSQISHELRTPLHGVTSQLELIREFSTPRQLVKLAPMLDVCDVCLESLRDVLDDTLDYAKFSGSTPEQQLRRSLVKGDLAQLAEDVMKATWVRKRRVDLVAADAMRATAAGSPDPLANRVDLILEVHERTGGWTGLLDAGGLKRCLLNFIGNALKWTEHGHVKLVLREPLSAEASAVRCREGQRVVVLEVEDTGKGMEEDFVRQKLFTPFVQADPFAQGAGLGMSLSLQIVQRLGGKIDVVSHLGKGTVIRCTIPLDLAPDSTPTSPAAVRHGKAAPRSSLSGSAPLQPKSSDTSPGYVNRRIISDELIALFNPARMSATPFEERQDFNFGQALDAAQNALGQEKMSLQRVPSSKRKRAVDVNLVDEVAKLSFSPAMSAPMSPPPTALDLGSDTRPSSGSQENTFSLAPVLVKATNKINVLFADDSSIARSILVKLFSGKGIPFTAASNGQEAVDAYKSTTRPFHLFLADVQMPVKDGIEASHEIREYEKQNGMPRCRIIALTGLNNEADMMKAGVLSEDGPVDAWQTKGGKSLRMIMAEVAAIQAELDATP